MRLLKTFVLVAIALSIVVDHAEARSPWWSSQLGRIKHRRDAAYAAAVSAAAAAQAAADAAAAAAAAAAAQQIGQVSGSPTGNQASGTLTISGGFSGATLSWGSASGIVLATNTLTVNGSNNAVLTTTLINRGTLTGTGTISGILTFPALGLSYSGATNTVTFANAVIAAGGTSNTTELDGSGKLSGTLALPSGTGLTFNGASTPGTSTSMFAPTTGTLATGNFSGGSFSGDATLTILSASMATLSLADGSTFNVGTGYNTASSSN